MTAHTDVVAQAEGRELRVEQAAEMLATNPQLPPDPQVVRALAELWIDYTLLAQAVLDDSTLAAINMDQFVAEVRDQALIGRLRDQVIQVDTVFDDAELQERWSTEGASAEISARHILLRPPADATDAQRDSVRQLAESLRQRAASGEPFEALASEYSQDPASAVQGGDLGYFGRGQMVQPFDEAAFALQPGQISPVVETTFGYHVIKVEDRRQPEMGDQREPFRQFLVQREIEQAELAFLDSLSQTANIQVNPSGLDVVREIANRPSRSLSGRQGDREIATYQNGELTAAEFAQFIRSQPPEVQSAFATATNEQLDSGVQQLVQMELLLAEADRRGLTLTAEEETQIRTDARNLINELVEATGFAEAARANATQAQLDEHVNQLVRGVVTGEAPFIPLGRLGVALREIYSYELNDDSFGDVVRRMEEIRAQQPQPQPMPMPQPIEPVVPDNGAAGGQPGVESATPPAPSTPPAQ